jgi:hypothetical protein
MAENISVTRIVDLPEGPYMGAGAFTAQGSGGMNMGGMNMGGMNMGGMSRGGQKAYSQEPTGGFSNTYMPMDIHPNPYGMPPPPPGGIMPPQHTLGRTAADNYIPDSQQRLPQRDIPMNTNDISQDEQIQPNYIPPPPKLTSDYIQEYQHSQDRQIREYEEKKMREKTRENWLEQLQWPILVGLIYFVFQLPIINTLVFKRFSFLSIYRDDGNFNFLGLLLKSSLFVSVYVSIQKLAEWMGEL